MRVAVALLTVASLGGTLATARPNDKNKTPDQEQASTGSTTKKQSKKKPKKESADKQQTAQPTTK